MEDTHGVPVITARIVESPAYRLEILSTFDGKRRVFGLCSGKESPLEEGWRIEAQIPVTAELLFDLMDHKEEVIDIAAMLYQLGSSQGVREGMEALGKELGRKR